MERDDIEAIRKRGLVGKICERMLVKVDIGECGVIGQRSRAGNVGGIEIIGIKFDVGIGGGKKISRKSLAAAKLAIFQWPAFKGKFLPPAKGCEAQQ